MHYYNLFKKHIVVFILSLFISHLTLARPYTLPLRDKIGQMLVFGFNEHTLSRDAQIVQWINQYHLGGVIAFDYDETGQTLLKNIVSRKQIRRLTHDLQSYTKLAEIKHHRPLVPLLISIDYEGGWVDRLKTADGFEPTLSPAVFPKLSKSKLTHELNKMSDYLKDAGFNLDLAPSIDVNVNPSNPIIAAYKRSYSSDPQVVTEFASLFMKSLRSKHIQCAFKHFPGHGSSESDSHKGAVDISKTWQSYELFPYQVLLGQRPTCGVVMAGHLVNRQLDKSELPATLSHAMLTHLLRQHLHFNGVIISDDLQMKAIREHYPLEQALTLAINAGVDLLLFTNQTELYHTDPKTIIDIIEAQVKSGAISQARINEAYDRIQTLKKQL